MYEEPQETPPEDAASPKQRAKEKSDEFRMHAELAAVFEGQRKFDAGIYPGLDAQLAREVQRSMAKLEKAKTADSPLLPPESAPEAAAVLSFPDTHILSTNNYHIHRRPGEVMIIRWLAGDQVDSYYERLQAHFDAALEGFKEDERQANEWKQDPQTLAYLQTLDALELRMADVYLREPIKKHNVFVLSTQAADEMNIAYICDYVMGVPAAEIVGEQSAPPEGASESELAWFFKMFSLRGVVGGVERMCFFAFLQKSDEGW
jgi:hypothetical protein